MTKTQRLGRKQLFPNIGERVRVIGCYSEIMMHFGLAGRPIEISLEYQTQWIDGKKVPQPERGPMAQVWKDGKPFSGLITTGEAGFYQTGSYYYCYGDDGPGDEDPAQVRRDMEDLLRDAMAGVNVTVITNLGL